MLIISIPELLSILLDVLLIFVKIALIFVIAYLLGMLFRWVWRSLVIPIFQRRAYFYLFKKDDEDGFYIEKPIRILFFRLRRNKRWAIQKSLVGYVAKKTGGSDKDVGGGALNIQNDIYYMSFTGKMHVGQVKAPREIQDINGGKIKICEVILKRSNNDGDTYYDAPIGYINSKGEVYKYYKDRKSALKGKKLDVPELIGYARAPQLDERKSFWGTYTTDVEAVDGIEDTNVLSEWFFFRKRKSVKVKAQKMNAKTTNRGFFSLWTLGWRVLHAYLKGINEEESNKDRKMCPWGVGYAVEDFWRNLFTKDVDGFSLDARAVAALLLAEKEGFYLRDAEQCGEDRKGLAPTALIALVAYLCIFPILNMWSALELWFGDVLGHQISKVIALIVLFFGVWLFVHILRMLLYDATDGFERVLNKMNNNVGTTNWNNWLIVASVIGLILSIFVVDYIFFPIFFSALVAVVTNKIAYESIPWDVELPFEVAEDESDSESKDESEADENDFDDAKEHSVAIFTPENNYELKFTIPYNKEKLRKLRIENPFRKGNTPEYSKRVHDMIQREFGDEVYSRIKCVKKEIERFALKHHLSYMEKINLILKLAQPDNIKYEYDWKCEELLPQEGEDSPIPLLLKDGEGYHEYCRYPSETLYDKRGDCDCHAALAVAMLAACGIRCCYFTNTTNDDTGHAALGIELNRNIQEYINNKNCFEYDGIKFIYAEATGTNCTIGDIPNGFEDMLKKSSKGTYAIVEPLDVN